MRLVNLALAFSLALPATAVTLGSAQPAWAKPAPITLSQVPAGAQAQGDALVGQMKNGRFPGVAERDGSNAQAFLYLAARHPDPAVVAAALHAMSFTWRRQAKPNARRPAMNADYVKVVNTRLTDADGVVRLGALRAARLPLGGKRPDATTVDTVLKMLAAKDAAERIAGLEAIYNVRDFQSNRPTKGTRKAQIIEAVMPLLQDKEPWLIAAAAHRLARVAYPTMPQAKTLEAQSMRLAKHNEAAIRGGALLLAANLAGKKPDARTLGRLRMSLKDASPYVRALSAGLLGNIGNAAVVHDLMPLLDDEAKAVIKVGNYRNMAGKQRAERFRPDGGSRVDVAAIKAIERLAKTVDRTFSLELKGRDRKAARAKAVADAKAWYAANKGKLPPALK